MMMPQGKARAVRPQGLAPVLLGPRKTGFQMRSFSVTAIWDAEAGVFYSDSDITGLHIEADTLDEFQAEMMRLAPELIIENHFSTADLKNKSFLDLMPSIIFNRPASSDEVAAC